jgi:uncharacterized protein
VPIHFDTIWSLAEDRFRLGPVSLHGPRHWRRVEENGLCIAESSGADIVVVCLFAALHDSNRQNEHHDPQHGQRAADWATELRTRHLGNLSDEQFQSLCVAMIEHDRGFTSTDPTIGTCWDADRLDLWRVGMTPHPRYMSTEAGRAACGRSPV